MLKARRSLASAELLLEDGDTEGACNRAYYAMFHAAHVALVALAAVPQSGFKTHRGLIAAFGQHVVTGANMDPELGRAIGQVQQVRQIADIPAVPRRSKTRKWQLDVRRILSTRCELFSLGRTTKLRGIREA